MSGFERDDGERIKLVLALIFLFVVAGGVVDLVLDRPTTLLSGHVVFEVGIVLVSLGSATYLARGWYRTQVRLARAEADSERRERESAAWRTRAQETLQGLSSAIGEQLDAWGLTPAEKRVALMLLRGYSHKRIARTTDTSERTVRQHSVAVYRKAGLSGRAELAGFFLEALPLSDGPATRG